MKYDISVVFCQYNPSYEKVIRSLYSLISQKEINYEIVIVDDGSNKDYFDRIKDFFIENNFSNYILHKNHNNIGTVKNILSGIELASGKYVFFNSPGDILVNDYVLRDYYQFAIKHKASCLFAKAIYYEQVDKSFKVHSATMAPPKPQAFNWYMPREFGVYALFRGDFILGAVFLREREYAYKYLFEISKTSKYVEDNTSAFLSLIEGEKIVFFDKVILWYEIGDTKSSEVKTWWNDACKDDIQRTNQMIKGTHSNAPFYDFVNLNNSKLSRYLRHPLYGFIHIVYNSLFPIREIEVSKDDENELQKYMKSISSNI